MRDHAENPTHSLEGADLRYRGVAALVVLVVLAVVSVSITIMEGRRNPGRDVILFVVALWVWTALLAVYVRHRTQTVFRVEYPYLLCCQGSRETKRLNLRELERAKLMNDDGLKFLKIKDRNDVVLKVESDLERYSELVALVESHIKFG